LQPRRTMSAFWSAERWESVVTTDTEELEEKRLFRRSAEAARVTAQVKEVGVLEGAEMEGSERAEMTPERMAVPRVPQPRIVRFLEVIVRGIGVEMVSRRDGDASGTRCGERIGSWGRQSAGWAAMVHGHVSFALGSRHS
jgi:hypothetical protein